MVEAFKKPFSIYIQLPPETIISRIENMQGKNTEITVSPSDDEGFQVVVDQKWGLVSPFLRFRVWKPDPNIKFSQMDGVAGAYLGWSGCSTLLVFLALLPCCVCGAILLTPDRLEYGVGYVERFKNSPWFNVYGLLWGIGIFLVLSLLHLILSPLASYWMLREFRHYFPDENENEKKKRS